MAIQPEKRRGRSQLMQYPRQNEAGITEVGPYIVAVSKRPGCLGMERLSALDGMHAFEMGRRPAGGLTVVGPCFHKGPRTPKFRQRERDIL